VSVELEMGLVRLDVLGVVVGTSGLMAVAVVVVSKELDTLHVHSPSSCGHRGQPVPLVSPIPHSQAQVYQGY
jgi:hypothetical protein